MQGTNNAIETSSVTSSVAGCGAGILEGFACLGDEFPLVAAGQEGQLQHAESFQRADFAVGTNHRERTKVLAAGAYDEFANAVGGIGHAVRSLWSEALVIVIMAVHDDVSV